MTVEFKNHRIFVHSVSPVELSDEETPVGLEAKGALQIGARHFGEGMIKITNRRILFEGSTSIGFDYRSMVMHAITGDDQCGKYIFVQLLSDEDEDQEAEDEIIKLIPSDESVVETMFSKINEMSALNPDEEEIDDNLEDEIEEDIF
jgi:hypothetical protein